MKGQRLCERALDFSKEISTVALVGSLEKFMIGLFNTQWYNLPVQLIRDKTWHEPPDEQMMKANHLFFFVSLHSL